jgi:hypothetical protein
MNTKDWQSFAKVNPSVELLAFWHKAADHVGSGKLLRFSATGKWSVLADVRCGPDGLPGFPVPFDKLLVPSAPPGALIGKVGGSTADLKDGTIFTIGSFAVFTVPEKVSGPLYIGVNAIPGAPISKLEQLDLTISSADP